MITRALSCLVTIILVSFCSTPQASQKAEKTYKGKPLQFWLDQMQSDQDEKRRQALEVLSALGPKDTEAVPLLQKALKSKEEVIRATAAFTLARIGRGAEQAIPDLARASEDDSPLVRRFATRALDKMPPLALIRALAHKDQEVVQGVTRIVVNLGSIPPEAVSPLIKIVKDPKSQARRFAVFTLGKIGPQAKDAVKVLIPLLGDANLRMSTARALAKIDASALTAIGNGKDDAQVLMAALSELLKNDVGSEVILPLLSPRLKSKEAEQRRVAVMGLGAIGGEASSTIPQIIQIVQKDENREVRVAAVKSLGAMGLCARAAAPALLEILKKNQLPKARHEVAEALWRTARHKDAAPALRDWLQEKDKSTNARIRTAFVLWRIDKSPQALEVYKEILRQGELSEKQYVLEMIRRIGPEAKATVSDIIDLLKKERLLRNSCLMVLRRFGAGASKAVPEIRKLVKDKNSSLIAAIALWDIAKDEKQIRSLAQRMLSDPNPRIRQNIVYEFWQMGARAKDATSELKKAMEDSNDRVRLAVAVALWSLSQDKKALKLMLRFLSGSDHELQTEAAVQLGTTFQGAVKETLPSLIQALSDKSPLVRAFVAESLGRIGAPARDAIPSLIRLLKDLKQPNHVHSAVAEALGLMGPSAKKAKSALMLHLKHSSSYVRACAALSLWNLHRSKAGLDVVKKSLLSRNSQAQVIAAEALWKMSKSKEALETMFYLLWHARVSTAPTASNLRYMIVRSLERMDLPAKVILPVLTELLSDEDADVRRTAQSALKKIKAKSSGD